jgi:hypothetical protein
LHRYEELAREAGVTGGEGQEQARKAVTSAVTNYFDHLKRGCAEVIQQHCDVLLITCTLAGAPHICESLRTCRVDKV